MRAEHTKQSTHSKVDGRVANVLCCADGEEVRRIRGGPVIKLVRPAVEAYLEVDPARPVRGDVCNININMVASAAFRGDMNLRHMLAAQQGKGGRHGCLCCKVRAVTR